MKVFICQICGHIEFDEVEGNCPVCGAPKEEFVQNDDIFKESRENSPEAESKHVPKVDINKSCSLIEDENCTDVNIRIGETVHPMTDKHYIKFVDCYLDKKFVERLHFMPDVYAGGTIHLKENQGKVIVVENCNIHGYWMKEVEV